MPEQIGKEPVQYFKALSLLNALKGKNLLAMTIGSGTKNNQQLSINCDQRQ